MSIRIGLTGGIGSGKSVVARLLSVMGVPVYISDDEAKRLMAVDETIRRGLTALVGDKLYEGGTLNKRLMADYLFSSRENAARVNGVVHPAVKADFRRWAEVRSCQPVVGIESAILIEAGFTDVVDRVVMVYAPMEVRVERAMARDGVERARVVERIAAQMDDETKRSRADFVILNDGQTPLIPQVEELIERLRNGD